MSLDADDLLERAEQALDRDIATTEEAKAELAAALDELERDFPNGNPGRGDARRSLRYSNLVSRVRHCRWQLENGQCVEFPRGRRSRLDAENRDEWQTFLDSHPELSDQPAPPPREPLAFTDDELLRALEAASRRWNERFPERPNEGVCSSHVADEVAGVSFQPGVGFVPRELRPSRGDVSRVGRALARMARDGRVRRVSRSWEGPWYLPDRDTSRRASRQKR